MGNFGLFFNCKSLNIAHAIKIQQIILMTLLEWLTTRPSTGSHPIFCSNKECAFLRLCVKDPPTMFTRV